MRVGPKADDIDRNPFVSLAYVSDPVKPAYAECIASWVNDRDERIEWGSFVGTRSGFQLAVEATDYPL